MFTPDRTLDALLALTTGVVPAQQQVQSQSLTPMRGVTANSVNGTGFRSNQMLVDGMDNTETHNGQGIVLYPPVDAIQEFNVQTSVATAEFGRGGGNINIRLKSGTQEFHGTLFEFLRNDKMDANPYSFTSIRTSKDPFKWNQYGFTLGGPVRVPEIFNGKDKLFFMGNYESYRKRGNTTGLYSLAPVAVSGPTWLGSGKLIGQLLPGAGAHEICCDCCVWEL
jgi:hypothetical protein